MKQISIVVGSFTFLVDINHMYSYILKEGIIIWTGTINSLIELLESVRIK
jgi:hypothetical protein